MHLSHQEWNDLNSSNQEWSHLKWNNLDLSNQGRSHLEWNNLDLSNQGRIHLECNNLDLSNQGWSHQEWNNLDSSNQGWIHQEWNNHDKEWNHQEWILLVLNSQEWKILEWNNKRNTSERDMDAFDRGIDLKERNVGGDPNPRPAQGQDLRNQILEVIDQSLGLDHRRAPRNPYRKPYPERIDREEWPRGFKAPDFTMFSGEDDKTAKNSHYAKLPAKSINSWEEMEEKFQSHFARSDIGVSMADLA
uniref:Retrotransposon gag domain-containing protein n=1 Tax=Fagus sylvatica TaxID=28930 RepID=A0A2N9G5N9_FAGSY